MLADLLTAGTVTIFHVESGRMAACQTNTRAARALRVARVDIRVVVIRETSDTNREVERSGGGIKQDALQVPGVPSDQFTALSAERAVK